MVARIIQREVAPIACQATLAAGGQTPCFLYDDHSTNRVWSSQTQHGKSAKFMPYYLMAPKAI